ncbi:DUF2306 domain-containing protein [Bacillus thermotolerans]|uniref:DUF2306 domain-containing protein n=1 Tax=Bacillus thermotolerans TaxID=1221996 RepID=A0A0F5I0I9_BACTR|nr:hypothetical protein [Bacillus thermotolerans]KKB35398.1 hypothetical protein QY97_01690 [Bacillus thermotolerans]KKB36241.1 hypothetical protein QY96_03457 [Bacillus thermotolerans]KKB39048.1 hypothetical protein QY95_02488 [Bacillus thermotolerans]
MLTSILITHTLAGTVCLISGLLAMSSRKRKGRHTYAGELYHGAYVTVFITALIMSIWHWEESQYLFYIALFSYGLSLSGYLAVKRKWKGWINFHIGGMLGSYIGIVTAVVVVNVPRIPLLNEWPTLLFWFLPTIIGMPLIFLVQWKYKPGK